MLKKADQYKINWLLIGILAIPGVILLYLGLTVMYANTLDENNIFIAIFQSFLDPVIRFNRMIDIHNQLKISINIGIVLIYLILFIFGFLWLAIKGIKALQRLQEKKKPKVISRPSPNKITLLKAWQTYLILPSIIEIIVVSIKAMKGHETTSCDSFEAGYIVSIILFLIATSLSIGLFKLEQNLKNIFLYIPLIHIAAFLILFTSYHAGYIRIYDYVMPKIPRCPNELWLTPILNPPPHSLQ